MGFAIDTWNDIAGPIYMGANSSWEVTWTLVSAACCILALVVGSMHEKAAYRREDEKAGQ
ncbi:MAG: hypothetical protein AAF439_14770 [Pseudomonadota bacterium]